MYLLHTFFIGLSGVPNKLATVCELIIAFSVNPDGVNSSFINLNQEFSLTCVCQPCGG